MDPEGSAASSPHPSPVPTPARPSDPAAERLRSPARVEALSDGVFAIVLTILVLEIVVPANLSEDSLRDVLQELRPTMVAWIISFLITGMYWVAHRDLFARVRYVTRDVVWLNLLFLLSASLIPFAASVLGEYPDEVLAIHLYGAIMLVASAMRVLLFWYVSRRPALHWDSHSDHHRRLGLVLSAVAIPVYLVAMLVAGVSTTLSVVLFFAVPILYFALVTLLRERPRTRDTADEFS